MVMSVLFYPESIRILGSDANGNNVILCEMAVDDIANLPAANAFINDGYVLSMGCKAIVINDNSVHRLNSVGQWVQIAAGTSTYTRAEIDTMLSAIDAENANQQAEIDYAINTGAKNYLVLTESSETISGVNWTVDKLTGIVTATRISGTSDSTKLVAVFNIQSGDYTFTSHQNASFTASDSFIQLSGTTIARDVDGFQNFTLTQDAEIRVSCRVRTGVTSAVFKPMIRHASIIDDTFEPYSPTNRQLYEMILQLQGG